MVAVVDTEHLAGEIAAQHSRDYDSLHDTVLAPTLQLDGRIGEPVLMPLRSRTLGIYYALAGEDYTEESQAAAAKLTWLVRALLKKEQHRDG